MLHLFNKLICSIYGHTYLAIEKNGKFVIYCDRCGENR
jgi:hypothetical protein